MRKGKQKDEVDPTTTTFTLADSLGRAIAQASSRQQTQRQQRELERALVSPNEEKQDPGHTREGERSLSTCESTSSESAHGNLESPTSHHSNDDPAAASDVGPVRHERGNGLPTQKWAPRPPNAWILYRSDQIKRLKAEKKIEKKPQSEISKLISYMWRDESPEVRREYEAEAVRRKSQHLADFPDCRFKPKRSRASTASGGRSPASPASPATTGLPDLLPVTSCEWTSWFPPRFVDGVASSGSVQQPLQRPSRQLVTYHARYGGSSSSSVSAPATPFEEYVRPGDAGPTYPSSAFVIPRTTTHPHESWPEYFPDRTDRMRPPRSAGLAVSYDPRYIDPHLHSPPLEPPMSAPACAGPFSLSRRPSYHDLPSPTDQLVYRQAEMSLYQQSPESPAQELERMGWSSPPFAASQVSPYRHAGAAGYRHAYVLPGGTVDPSLVSSSDEHSLVRQEPAVQQSESSLAAMIHEHGERKRRT